MGYSATVGSYKKAMTELLPVLDITVGTMNAGVSRIVYHKYLDWSSVNTITIGYLMTSQVAAGIIYIYKDGTQIYTQTAPGVGDNYYSTDVTIPAVNQCYGLVEVKVDAVGGGNTILKNFKGYRKD